MSSNEDPIMRERANDLRDEYELIYAEPDPRAYFRVLHGLDYCLPELGRGLTGCHEGAQCGAYQHQTSKLLHPLPLRFNVDCRAWEGPTRRRRVVSSSLIP